MLLTMLIAHARATPSRVWATTQDGEPRWKEQYHGMMHLVKHNFS